MTNQGNKETQLKLEVLRRKLARALYSDEPSDQEIIELSQWISKLEKEVG